MKDLGVLVVDDDSAILSLIERLFGHFKVKVYYVASATEALERLKTEDYKIMITNVELSGMGGLELTRKARELLPYLNIVLFTGNTTEQVINLVLAPKVLDISGVHIKPCGLDYMLMSFKKQESGSTFLMG